jgi:hypothetical protein
MIHFLFLVLGRATVARRDDCGPQAVCHIDCDPFVMTMTEREEET